ncbi:MAG TPA: hypothetical protein VG479_02435 [Gaiellaceae bacterium]|jgi:hypothetical protein|nr:hypothetical protein [Gaiellaceae bacterium]
MTSAEPAAGQPDAPAKRRLVLVVGIGRSGTSLLTGILAQLGFRVPQPEVRADETNPRGFGEPRWVVDFHSRLMRERRVGRFDSRPSAWQTTAAAADEDDVFEELRSWLAVQFVGTDNVVVKDPRIGWFLPLWVRCAAALGVEVSFVFMLRPPSEIVLSARRWYGAWQADASRAASWLNVTLETELATRGAPRAFVRYDDLLAGWAGEISRVGELLEVPWLVGLDPSRHPDVGAFVDPALRRSVTGWSELEVPASLRDLVDATWPLVSRLAERDGDDEQTRAALDVSRASYARFYAEAEQIAQSSVIAVKPRGRGPRRRPSGSRTGGASSPNGRVPRLARLVPARLRGRLASAGVTGMETLPVRLVLLVPPRYRERVPLVVVRAGLRTLRARRRA